jgi:hypothetical protein
VLIVLDKGLCQTVVVEDAGGGMGGKTLIF